jgi:Ca2+-binding EF-hand superfamily protein
MILDIFHGKTDDDEIKRLFKLMDQDNNNYINLKGSYFCLY